jgi:hypothetical protein
VELIAADATQAAGRVRDHGRCAPVPEDREMALQLLPDVLKRKKKRAFTSAYEYGTKGTA